MDDSVRAETRSCQRKPRPWRFRKPYNRKSKGLYSRIIKRKKFKSFLLAAALAAVFVFFCGYGVHGACTGAMCWRTEAWAWLWCQEAVRC
ncbi:hypothetical protein ES288_A06G053000v1 [Gossypium darwinii]|uniref:Uncharacterized protein n=1 Tax=Gossypium darwinii TaxID=34276 RepID=A0A5D2G3H0_GOSDA|nr:hypothetical protein ES288_A06G053000v1 [Gossypium darwinii]